jgi:5'-nucleotidase
MRFLPRRTESVMIVRKRLLALTTLLLGMLIGPEEAVTQALDILLTNEDGFEAGGIRVLRDALTSAGHSVTIVAPLDDRDGSGMALTTSGTIDYYRQEDGVWAVDGTPSDAVTLALVHLLRDRPPDLVVAGVDIGSSAGAGVLVSGTVGAAMTAARTGLPAIAVSVAGIPAGDRSTGGAPPAGVGPACALLVEIVRQLAETGGGGLLPPRTILNVNHPARDAGELAGVRFATVSTQRGFRQLYSVAGDSGPARVEIVQADVARVEEGSDLALLERGYVTISVLDGDWDAGRESWEPLLRRLVIER